MHKPEFGTNPFESEEARNNKNLALGNLQRRIGEESQAAWAGDEGALDVLVELFRQQNAVQAGDATVIHNVANREQTRQMELEYQQIMVQQHSSEPIVAPEASENLQAIMSHLIEQHDEPVMILKADNNRIVTTNGLDLPYSSADFQPDARQVTGIAEVDLWQFTVHLLQRDAPSETGETARLEVVMGREEDPADIYQLYANGSVCRWRRYSENDGLDEEGRPIYQRQAVQQIGWLSASQITSLGKLLDRTEI